MRQFHLQRDEDESGVSGIGAVAEGVEFTNGKCILTWLTKTTSWGLYDSIKDVETLHGHSGKTRIVFGPTTPTPLESFAAGALMSLAHELREGRRGPVEVADTLDELTEKLFPPFAEAKKESERLAANGPHGGEEPG